MAIYVFFFSVIVQLHVSYKSKRERERRRKKFDNNKRKCIEDLDMVNLPINAKMPKAA